MALMDFEYREKVKVKDLIIKRVSRNLDDDNMIEVPIVEIILEENNGK